MAILKMKKEDISCQRSFFQHSICAAAFERGLVMETAGVNDQVAKVMPPLTIDEKSLEDGLNLLEEAATSVLNERFSEDKSEVA